MAGRSYRRLGWDRFWRPKSSAWPRGSDGCLGYEVRVCQVRVSQVRVSQVRVSQVRVNKVRVSQDRASQVRVNKPRLKVGASQVRFRV